MDKKKCKDQIDPLVIINDKIYANHFAKINPAEPGTKLVNWTKDNGWHVVKVI